MKSYICPHCKEKQTTVIQWQDTLIAYEFDLKSGESEKVDEIVGEHESFACPACGKDLPRKLNEKFWKII